MKKKKIIFAVIVVVVAVFAFDLIGSIPVRGEYNIFGTRADKHGLIFGKSFKFNSKVKKNKDADIKAKQASENRPKNSGELTEKEKRQEFEKTIYTYFQGPKALEEKLPFSGEWGDLLIDGKKFGAFGCGLCCTANVYASFSNYKATPLDTYRFSKEKTAYYGGGAIGWGDLKKSLIKSGFKCSIHNKDKRYNAFKKRIFASKCAIVLVSSYDSTEYWVNTPGHYVTIFAYDGVKDKVFLGDSGDPKHNRRWVDLKVIYNSLKTISAFQYIAVRDYDEAADQFKNQKETGKWNKPEWRLESE
ncbi:MAG: hypothetical protein K6D02_06205 [Lachnospiraceae bacterium]|nr:hypothetical protein [Lachnospiraceae bacterium]